MLKPRFEWTCLDAGCCVFSGGTAEYDLYMGKCHERPWNPGVLLVVANGLDYEFENQEAFAKYLERMSDRSATEPEALGRALAFVQCFFPTPERWALNEARKNDAAV
jgi:hypothetical protein